MTSDTPFTSHNVSYPPRTDAATPHTSEKNMAASHILAALVRQSDPAQCAAIVERIGFSWDDFLGVWQAESLPINAAD